MSENQFVAYEYISIPVKQTMETLYIDSFKCFGWILENSVLNISNVNSVILKFKRDRRIKNRSELSELQRKCEDALIAVERLERSKTSTAAIKALIIGVIGISFVTGAVFSFLANQIPLFIFLSALGLIGCVLPYFVYNKTREKKTLEVTQLVDKQFDIIYEACEKASKMLV